MAAILVQSQNIYIFLHIYFHGQLAYVIAIKFVHQQAMMDGHFLLINSESYLNLHAIKQCRQPISNLLQNLSFPVSYSLSESALSIS